MKVLRPFSLCGTKRFLIRLLALFLAFTITITLYILGPWVHKAEAAWWNENWAYRKAVTLTDSGAETNKYATLSSYDASDTSKYQSDCGDVRFTDANGKLLPYTVSSCGATTTFHVNINSILSGSQTVYIYYGNPSASNGFISSDPYSACSGCSFGSPASEEKAPQPLAYWKFDEASGTTAHDSTTNNHTVTLAGGSSTPSWVGKENCIAGTSCLKFDGVNDYASSSAMIDLSQTPVVTVEFWMKWEAYANDDGIALEFSQNTNNTTTGFFIDPNYGTGVFVASLKGDAGTNDVEFTRPKAGWHHYAFVFDKSQSGANEVTPYVDGVPISYSKGFSNDNTNNFGTNVLNIMSRGGASLFGGGLMDELKIYPYTRTALQIKADYNAPLIAIGGEQLGGTMVSKQQLSYGLVHYYKFDESSWTNDCSTLTAKDSAGIGDLASCPNTTGPTTPGTGKYGNAATFDGSDDQLIRTYAENYGKRWTVSEWFKTSDTQGYLFDTRNNNVDGGINGVAVFTDGANTFSFFQMIGNVNTKYYNYTSATLDGNWHHLVVTRDGDNSISFYIDKIKLTPSAINADSDISSSDEIWGGIDFGMRFLNGIYPLNGSIDEARFYSRSFSQNDVNNLYEYAPGPVGYWKLDEKSGTSANDSSGNGNTGTLTNGPSWVQGKVDGGINFDGADDYITVNHSGSLNFNGNSGSFSVGFWLKTKTTDNNDYYLAKWTSGSGAYPFKFESSTGANGKILFSMYDGTNNPGVTSNKVINDNSWHYVEGVVSNADDKLYLYIDGVLDNSTSNTTTTSAANTDDIRMMRNWSTQYTAGSLDQVIMYNYARSSQQVVEDMNGGSTAVRSGTASPYGYWSFDEGYGSTAHPSGYGSGLTGSITNGTWTNAGKVGKALVFNNTDSHVVLKNGPIFYGSSAGSISAWVYPTSTGSERGVYSEDDSSGTFFHLSESGGYFFFSIFQSNSTWSSCQSSSTYSTNTWYHLVATFDAATGLSKIYVNGKLSCSVAWNGTFISATITTSQVGDYNNAGTYGFGGTIDEVKTYLYALTADEVKIDYNGNHAQLLGAAGNNSSYEAGSANQEYCVPGDSTSCAGPVGEWNFDEGQGTTVNDTSGNGNTGTWNGTGMHWKSGKVGKAGIFNGNDDYVDVTSSSSLNITGPITINAWVNPKDFSVARSLITKGAANCTTDCPYDVYITTSGTLRMIRADAASYYEVTSIAGIPVNKWSYVTVIDTGSAFVFYLNGVQMGTSVTHGSYLTPTTTSSDVRIGLRVDNVNKMLGSIDELRVYNYARSTAQVAWDYNHGAPVAYWDMDECQGSTVHDLSGNGLNGALTVGAGGTQTSAGDCVDSGSTAWYNGRNGKINYSLNFDGTDDYINAGTSSTLDVTSSMTISAWVNSNSTTSTQMILARTDGNNGYEMWINPGVSTETIGIWPGGPSGGNLFSSFYPMTTGTWHLVTVVFESGTATFYINGQVISSGSYTLNSPGTQTFYMGLESPGVEQFHGKIDDVRVYNYPLTAAQVQLLYNGGAVRFGPSQGTP